MTQTSFFTNFRLSAIFGAIGYFFIFAGTYWAKQKELELILVGLAVCCLVTALYFITKDYNKQYDEIKRL